jgi:mRNA interferase RelE/StbE
MAWKVELDPMAVRALDKLHKLHPQIAKRILAFLHGRLAPLDNPRSLGEALTGSKLGEYWKYRVGDYRIIAEIEDKILRISVIKIGNRRDVYR